MRFTPAEETQELRDIIQERCIRRHEGQEKLRWGYMPKGVLSIKEVYDIWTSWRVAPEDIWKKYGQWTPGQNSQPLCGWLCKGGFWLGKTQKKSFYGPFWCSLCIGEEDTVKHLFTEFLFISLFWHRREVIFVIWIGSKATLIKRWKNGTWKPSRIPSLEWRGLCS